MVGQPQAGGLGSLGSRDRQSRDIFGTRRSSPFRTVVGHLEKLTFSERAIWMEGRPAGFVARDRNGSAWFLRSRRALSRSRCQEGPAGFLERGCALGGLPRSVERGLAQAGGGAEERGRTQALGRDRHLQGAGSAGALQSL